MSLLLAATGALLWLAGCGGGSSSTAPSTGASTSRLEGLTARQVLDATEAAAKSAGSVHIAGELTTGGQVIKLDLSILNGRGGRGTVHQGGSTAEIILIGNDVYLRGDRTLYEGVLGAGAGEAIKLIGDKYVKAPATDERFGSLVGMLELGPFIDGALAVDGALTRVPGRPIDGTPTVGVKDDDLENGGILYVADASPPYPVLLESLPGAKETGAIRFDWSATPTITAPSGDQVIDLAKLTGG